MQRIVAQLKPSPSPGALSLPRWLTIACLAMMGACGRETPQPPAAPIAAVSATPRSDTVKPPAAVSSAAPQPIVLADDSLLNFRGSPDKSIDRTPLKDIQVLRVLVTYNRTTFFVDRGQPRGYEYEYMREFERFLNQRLRGGEHPVRLEFVVTDFDRLLPDLVEGRGDVIAANFTITRARDEKADFSLPYLEGIDEMLVANRQAPQLASVEALSGKRVLVVRGSSYAEHLARLAVEQERAGRAPVNVVQAESNLEAEDILEMVNARIVDYTVADSHVARLWSQVLPNILVRDNLVVNKMGNLAWATRPECRELREALDAFVRQDGSRSGMNSKLFERYFRDTRWIGNPAAEPMLRRQASAISRIRTDSQANGLDWRLVLAHAAAESGFDQSRRGPGGAVGIMQVTPQMAAAVHVTNIEKPEQNILAGVRYLAKLRDDYARETGADANGSVDLALAAYRIGPDRLRTLQNYASQVGLDPRRWQKNVELVSDLTLGDEPSREMHDVYKYYEAYRLNGARSPQSPLRP